MSGSHQPGRRTSRYPTDVSDAQWAELDPLLPDPACLAGRGGRWEKHCRRLIVDAILYVVDSGIKWRALPVRAALRRRKTKAVIPERRDQVSNRLRKGSAGGRPPSFDAAQYKRRNQVERGFNRRKRFRAVATRYDKLGSHWQATNYLVEIIDWIRATPDKPDHDPADMP